MAFFAWVVRTIDSQGNKAIGIYSEPFPTADLRGTTEPIATASGPTYAAAHAKLVAWCLDPKRVTPHRHGAHGEVMIDGLVADAGGLAAMLLVIAAAVGVGLAYKYVD